MIVATMSSKRAEKAEEPRGGSEEAPPHAKRQKSNHNAAENQTCLLLETRPSDILRNVYSFLTLKEALPLRSTCRRLNDERGEIYQYSVIIMNRNVLVQRGLTISKSLLYVMEQERALKNISDSGNLRALLRNETLAPDFCSDFMENFIKHCNTDDGQAVSAIMESTRCHVNSSMLEALLRKDFTAMAQVLQEDTRAMEGTVSCATCDNNIGCHSCSNKARCVEYECDEENEYQPMYCRQCVVRDDRFCKVCNEYLCPLCFGQQVFKSCEKCHGIKCRNDRCFGFLYNCGECGRNKCLSCLREDGDAWTDSGTDAFCSTCSGT